MEKEEEKRELDPENLEDSILIMQNALGELRGTLMRVVWRAFDTVENAVKEKKKIEVNKKKEDIL